MSVNISHFRGDTFLKNITITGPTGDPIDLTGATIKFSVKERYKDTIKILNKTATIVDAAAGKAKIEVPANEMVITPRTYVYDIQFTDSAGIVRTIVEGVLTINYDVTTP